MQRQIWVYDQKDGLWTLRPVMSGIEVGAHCGSVVVQGVGGGEQEEDYVTPSLDTFIGMTQNWCDGNTYTDAGPTANGGKSYMRHGHHWATNLICASSPNLGYGNINWRALGRFSFAGWGGRTIISVVSIFDVEIPSLVWDKGLFGGGLYYRSGWSGGTINRLLIDDWDDNSIWGSINGGGAWNDGVCIGASYASISSSGGTVQSGPFDAAGKAFIQNACDGAGDPGGAGTNVNLTLNGRADGNYTSACKITSWRLLVVYTA